jgi:alanyl-tRNA synthetase
LFIHRYCSHVAKTGDIKDFVITEESGIAKGIRRIVAVTGHEAHEVTRVAHSLSEKLSTIEASAGKAKDAALRAMTVVRFYNACLFSLGSSNTFYRNSTKLIYPC